jgi:hypothetical protein
MKWGWCSLLWLALATVSPADAQPLTRQNLANILGFENNSRAGVFPAGWGGNPGGGIVTDHQVVHSGKYSASIERNASSPVLAVRLQSWCAVETRR